MNKALLKHECRQLKKTTLIWSLAVGLLGLLTIAVFSSLQGDMEQMSEQFAKMGAFADAVGMNKMSIGTIEGYYAVEVSVIFGLGGAMFAASVAINMLSKEEGGHTGEFLYATSVSRGGATPEVHTLSRHAAFDECGGRGDLLCDLGIHGAEPVRLRHWPGSGFVFFRYDGSGGSESRDSEDGQSLWVCLCCGYFFRYEDRAGRHRAGSDLHRCRTYGGCDPLQKKGSGCVGPFAPAT